MIEIKTEETKTKRTKTQDILDYLKTHEYITSMDAIQKFRATRLSSHIFELRKRGYTINTVIVEDKDALYGNTVQFARYYLVKQGG